VKELTAEHGALARALDADVTAYNPGVRRVTHGVGPDTAAQLLVNAGGNPDRMRTEASFAALCGAAPVPASSGSTNRHRPSRGGDRAANAALYRIALVRMSSDPGTRAYVVGQTTAGRTTKEITRLLRRATASRSARSGSRLRLSSMMVNPAASRPRRYSAKEGLRRYSRRSRRARHADRG
jgi:transposase